MKKTIVLTIILAVLVIPSYAFAHFFSEYPDFFIEDGKLDVVIVVGQKAPSSHVLAQTQLALSLSSKVNEKPVGITKLDNEIGEINETNIISIGSACLNSVTREILDNPEPCDNGLVPGKATIQILETEDGKVHIVLNAYSEEGIRRAARVLADHKRYNLDGNLVTLDVEEKEAMEDTEEKAEPEESPIEEPKESIGENEEPAPYVEPEKENEGAEPTLSEDKGVIKKIISFILSLFGR